MLTLSMRGVAELTRVRREVVTMWRSRCATSDRPFPSPVRHDPLAFDASEVAQWLQDTGRGNNADAPLEVALHSDIFERLLHDPAGASALLLVHRLRGVALADTDFAEVVPGLAAQELGAVLNVGAAAQAFRAEELKRCVDELSEAAFSAEHVLGRLMEAASGDAWKNEALTEPARLLMVRVLRELVEFGAHRVIPHGPGALLSTVSSVASTPDTQVTCAYRAEDLTLPWGLAAWRYLIARGGTVTPFGEESIATGPHVHLLQRIAAVSEKEFFDDVENTLLDLRPQDLLVVLGPACWMMDREGVRGRRSLLVPPSGHVAPLRYVARLPRGLARHGGRRRLALWVFGLPESHWTVVGAHSDAELRSAAGLIAADIAVAVDPAVQIHTHAFQRSEMVASAQALSREVMVRPMTSGVLLDGGRRLAAIWELEADLASHGTGERLLHGITLASAPARPHVMILDAAAEELAKDLPGTRIPAEHIAAPQRGFAVVLGEAEIRNPARPGSAAAASAGSPWKRWRRGPGSRSRATWSTWPPEHPRRSWIIAVDTWCRTRPACSAAGTRRSTAGTSYRKWWRRTSMPRPAATAGTGPCGPWPRSEVRA